ncbi:MAG: tetratricopeptide repeat protein [Roseiarcus sp.]
MTSAPAAKAAIAPSRAVGLYIEAQSHWRDGDAAAAAVRLDEALRLQPDFAEALAFGAYLLERSGKGETALRFYQRALELKRDMWIAWSNLGKLMFGARRFAEALAAFDEALALRPDEADLLNSRAGALRELGRLADSERAARRALVARPDHAEAALNLGNALFKQGRPAEALAAYERAGELRASYGEALCGMALSLRALGRLAEARERFREAEALGCREAISGGGCLDLMLGDFENGWEGYEARWIAGRSLSEALGARYRQWRGPGAGNERVLVLNDHGLGDTIQFARYLPLIEASGAETTFVLPRRLHRLLGAASRARLVEAAPEGETFDAQIALSSLPRAFRTRLGAIPGATPYLAAEPDLVASWRRRIGDDGFRIGVVWQGNPDPAADPARSFALAALQPLAAIASPRLISLQKGFGREQIGAAAAELGVETLGDDFDGGPDAFVDTAAAMMSLDLVVACDTSVAHLAGALHRPVWIALKFDAEWRWMRDRDDSPWYPSARLFRQTRAGDWDELFARMARALAERLQSRTP